MYLRRKIRQSSNEGIQLYINSLKQINLTRMLKLPNKMIT
jgi:hypothetical protein